MNFGEWARKKKQEEQEIMGMRETASSGSASWAENRRETPIATNEPVRDAASFGEWARRKRGLPERAPQTLGSWGTGQNNTPSATQSTTKPSTSYLDTARNAGKTTVAATSTLSEDERKKRMDELNSEIEELNSAIELQQNGISRASVYGSVDNLRERLREDQERLKALQDEYTTLERSGEHTEADELRWQIEDAEKRKRELDNSIPAGEAAGRAAAYAWKNNPELQDEYIQQHGEFVEAKSEQESLEALEAAREYVVNVDEKSYEDDFGGQFGANYRLGRINQDMNDAFNRYLINPTEENKEAAYTLWELANEFQTKYDTVLDDEGAILPWITQDAAGYLPQFVDQGKAQLGGGALGGAVGFLAGNPIAGARVGATAATGLESYGQMRGAAFRAMIEAGADEEEARAAANDEALINALIESGMTYLSFANLGTKKMLNVLADTATKSGSKAAPVLTKLLGKSAVDKAASVAAKEAGKTTGRKVFDTAVGIGKNAVNEAIEEAAQQGVSIANRNREGEGIVDLAKEAGSTLWDAATGEDGAARNEIADAAWQGFKVALMFGGAQSVVNNVASNYLNAKSNKQREAVVDAVMRDDDVLTALVEEGKASGENSVSAKLASEIESNLANGKSVTREQVKSLIAANDVYIKEESRAADPEAALEQAAREMVMGEDTPIDSEEGRRQFPNVNRYFDQTMPTARNAAKTAESDIKKLGYGEHGRATLASIAETQELSTEEVNAEFHLPYLQGLSNMDVSETNFTSPLQQEAFNAGKLDRIMNTKKDVEKSKFATVYGKESGLVPSAASKTYNPQTVETINKVSKAFGTKTMLEAEIWQKDGKIVPKGTKGAREADAAMRSDGVLMVSLNAGDPIYTLIKHEVTHRFQQLAPVEYGNYRDAVMRYVVGNDVGAGGKTSTVERYQNALGLDVNKSSDEIAADFTKKILKDEAEFSHFVDALLDTENNTSEQIAQNRTFLQKFVDTVREFIDKVKRAFSGDKGKMDDAAQKEFGATVDQLERIESLWKEAAKKSAEVVREKSSETKKSAAQTSDADYKVTGDGIRYSMKMSFEEQVDAALHNELDRFTAVYVADTPDIIQAILNDYPMLMTQKHIRDITLEKGLKKGAHGITEAQMKKLPSLLRSPAMMLNSLSRPGDLVVVTTEFDSDNLPVIVAIKPEGKGQYNSVEITTNFITSMYGRGNFGGYIERSIKQNAVLYVNEKRTRSLLAKVRVQFPESLAKDGFFNNNIAQFLENVKAQVPQEDFGFTDSKAQFSMKDVGYHAGDLGKAEGYWNMVSSNRGTGHFGTGTYFVGDEAQINNGNYANRPHEKVDFSKYNLFKPLLENDGFNLHRGLKYINNSISRLPLASMSFDERYGAMKAAEDADYTLYWDDDATAAEKTKAKKALDDLKERFADIGYDPDAWGAERLYEELNDLGSDYRNAVFNLSMVLGVDEEKIADIMRRVHDDVSTIEDAYAARYEDSPSTRFMKALGYEGIDVRGFKGLDNTAYGSVIYDLKGEDAQRKAEIGTARFSMKDSAGRELSDGQREYFKDSKERDKNGNLRVMYNGGGGDFTVFDRKKSKSSNLYGRGFYFTNSESHAKQYGNARSYYLNIVNPVSTDERTITKKQLRNFLEAVAANEDDYSFENYGYGATVDSVLNSIYSGKSDFAMLYDVSQTAIGDMVEAVELFNEVNGTEYDGLILDTETVIFNSEQAKLTSNENPTSDPDVRFSMKKPRESGKNLIAMHNLSAEKLKGALELGGFPMPSIAIVKNDMGHDKFGDISVLFRKDTIRPTDRRNKVYGGDAWTPTMPSLGYKVNDKVRRNIRDRVAKLLEGTDLMTEYRLMLDEDNVDDAIRRWNGDFKTAYGRNEALRIAFLKDKGVPFNPVMREKQYSHTADNIVLRRIDRALGGKSLEIANRPGTEEAMKQEPLIRKLLNDWYEEQGAPRVYDKPLGYAKIDQLLRAADKYAREGAKKEIDTSATRTRLENKFTKKLTAEYEAWLDELSDGIIEKRGIRNDRDMFTPSGNRRSFEQLYMEYNLQNIVKAMAGEEAQKGGGLFGTGNIHGAATKDYASIEEIKADSARLMQEDEEAHEAAKSAFNDRFADITARMVKPGDDGFGATLDAGDAAVESLLKGKSVNGILRELKSWRRFNATQEIAQDIYDLARDISEAPTAYFEAKPRRAVGFDEVAAVVMPRSTSADLKARLEGFGVQVLTYNPKKDGDRLKKINSVDDISFSMKGQSSLLDENKKLREVNEALREQFKTTKFAQVEKKQLDAFAKKLLQDYGSGADINETRDALNDLYVYMANGEDGQAPVWNEVQRRAYDAAVSILEEASTINDDLYKEYKSLRNRLRMHPISISKEYDGDLGGYESINEFRKANFGRIKLTNDGTPVDVVYNDLANTYPEFFDEYHYSTQADQLVHIAEVLDSLKPYEVNPYSYNMREAASWLADDIIERFYELPQAKPTFADKAEQKLTKQVIKDAKKLETLRDKKNERIAKLIEQSREKVRKTQEKERTKRAEAVAKVRDHYEAKERRASDRRKASIWRKKIKKHVDTISKLLLKGNDNSHVPEEMREVVSEFLSVIDLTTPRQKEKTINRLNELRTLYKKIADNETEIETEVDPDLAGYIDDVTAALKQGGDTVSVADLNNRELEALYRVLLAVERSIYMHNRAMADGKTAQISEIAQKVMIENSAGKAYQEHSRVVQWGADMVNMDMLNPQDYFIQLGDTMNDMFGSIRNGFDKKIRLLAEAKAYMGALLKGVDVKSLSGKKAVAQEFKTGNGQTISLTPAQVMSLYLLQRQKDALDHIYKGGIKPAPVVARGGKDKRAKVKRSYDVVKVTPDDVAKILKSMTPEQQKIADGISKFFTDYTAKWGNEVSLALYGYKKFTVENYFPIVSDQNYLKDVFGETTDATLKNMGSTKARIQGASNPIIIEDAIDVFARQADQMSSYNAFVIPLSDIQRVFNFKTSNGSVKQSIEKRYGVRATQYFKKLMTDINGGSRWNGGSQLMNEMVSRYKQAKMGLNLRVILQQPSAMLRAQAVIDGKYLAQAMATKSSVDLETIYKYAPVAQWKNWGFFSMDTGKQMKDVILDNKQLSDYTMWAAGKMDEITWKRLWVASELEVRDKQPDLARGSEEYLEAVGKRFSEIIDRTQVVDSVLHRSQIMRNPDALVKMSVAFMNEPFKAYNMVRTAATQFKHKPTQATKQALWAAGVAYMSTLIVNHLITAAVDTWRGDEEDEEWLEKIFNKVFGEDEEEKEPKTLLERYLWHFADNAVNEPLSMFPFVKDIVSMVQGYDVKRMDMQGVGDFVNALTRGLSDKYTITQKVIDIGSKFGDLLGIPVSSLKRELSSVVKLGIGAAGSPMLEYEADKVLYTVTGNKSRFMDILYKAYKAGDMEAYRKIAQDMIDEGITPSSIESGIKSRAKKDGVSVKDMNTATFSAGVEAKYEVEKPVEDKFDINKLSGNQYTQFIEDRGQMLDEIISDFQRRGFGSLDEETANELLTAAYTFAEETALEDASGGLYESDTKWIDKAQNAGDLGLTVSEYLMLRSEYDSDIGADGVYDAYNAGVDVETYLEFKDGLGDLEYAKGVSGARKAAVADLLDSMGLTQDEWDYLFGTEYKTSSGGFGGSFGGGSFGGSFGGKFGK